MGILIANIGTSDLAIKINVDGQEYYVPIDPLAEPNQDINELTPQELAIWKNPQQYFKSTGLYEELGFPPEVIPHTRQLTENLLQKYTDNPETWHLRIHAPRIWGVIQQALALGINQGYIFVSDQKSPKIPKGHPKDTLFLYEILKMWFQDKQPDFQLIKEVIPLELKLNIPDDLFQYYYEFFSQLNFNKEKKEQKQRYPQLHEIIAGKVVSFDAQNQGLFVEVNGGVQGFVNINNISEPAINPDDLKTLFKVGDLIWVKVINSEVERLRFSTKELEETPGEIIQNHQAVYHRINQEIQANSELINQPQLDEEMILISIKGGTPQMRTALQLQGISVSAVKKLLFVNPQLSISTVFQGIPSNCELESYWRYIRTQKYQTIKILLERWDFDGAVQILGNWQDYLNFLIKTGVVGKEDVKKSSDVSKLVLQVLDFARACFNLDFQTAKQLAQAGIDTLTTYPELSKDIFPKLQETADKYGIYQHRLLSIYTQNRIYWHLDQISSFLAHLSSFCEEILHGLILKWEGKANYWLVKLGRKYRKATSEAEIKSGFIIDVQQIKISNQQVWDHDSLQRQFDSKFATGKIASLNNRFTKRYFVQALVNYRNNPQEIEAWGQIINGLQQLDFWIDQRNKLIHTATGFSKSFMVDLYREYSPDENSRISKPCHPHEILDIMAAITKNKLVDLKTIYRNKFVGNEAEYYIYTLVNNWVVNTLVTDGMK
ncbi:S1 RNA-binding domain-containing protein [Nodularia sp. LEGE 04288]|uniref:S1 RNA-binding domain-containing protein n=1 Tax=Nodularia sp. LEGE 04288 TaxID=1828639 RepID=UPI001D12B0CC|nr:S1 RNA-binding domain-containing protein [Nodularia sp. LEGE 04288]MCC2694875.1 S1 RNA-binding domain-containing protein [Nodularia sp. LEGE 04288]